MAQGANFFGGQISWDAGPPRKHSLLHRFKLGNREAFSKMKILKVLSVFMVSLHNLFVSKFDKSVKESALIIMCSVQLCQKHLVNA